MCPFYLCRSIRDVEFDLDEDTEFGERSPASGISYKTARSFGRSLSRGISKLASMGAGSTRGDEGASYDALEGEGLMDDDEDDFTQSHAVSRKKQGGELQ